MSAHRGRSLRAALVGSLVLGAVALGLVVGGSVPASATTPIIVNCSAGGDLQAAINSAASCAALVVSGTCTGNFYIDKDLTLSGPAVLDGGGVPTTYGTTLNVMGGTVVLNKLVIQDGVGIDGLGGGLWNGGQLTLNDSTVSNNTAAVGGIFNFGQLTLNNSTVTHNTSTFGGGGGIFNCGASLHNYGLCTGAPGSLTLNHSTVSNNNAAGDGGGILNDGQTVLKLVNSTVSGNSTTGGSGGGIANNGTATVDVSTVSGNSSSSGDGGGIVNSGTATVNFSSVSSNTSGHLGGGIENHGTATISWSMVSKNTSTGGLSSWSGGGGLSNTGPTTINNSIVLSNSAAWLGGGVFAEGPMTINKSIVTGNAAGPQGGGLVVWDGPTTVANSAFWNNSDQAVLVPDNPAGVWVAPADFGGFFTNHPTFTTTHSTYN